jgi:hypothetical protein
MISNGIHTDISIQDYHANKTHISATGIKLAKKSLKLWKWMQTHPMETKAHFEFGNAFELALLDKENFKSQVAIAQTQYWIEKANAGREKPYVSPKQSGIYQGELSKFESVNEGKYLIPDVGDQSFESIEYMLESCYRDATIQKLITNTEYQLSLFWEDVTTGMGLKTRPDICKRKKNVIVNLKTTLDGSPTEFSRTLANYDFPLQAAIEIRGCIATGLMQQVDNYFWLVVEKVPPYNATLYEFEKQDQEYSFDELEFLLNKIQRAREEDMYPGYSDRADNPHGILTAQVPVWYKTIYS